MTKYCPECQATLTHTKHQIFHSWVCPEGHGTLYPSGELERIVEALSGLGQLEVALWNNQDRYSVVESTLISPDGNRPMLEIRDKEHPTIIVYGDEETHSLWLHTGEEEKLMDYIEAEMEVDSVSSYVSLAAEEAIKIFDDREPLKAAGHTLASLKLLGERILRAMPHITL